MPHGRPKCRSGHKTVTCSGLTMYCTSRVRLGAQHNATLTTAEHSSTHAAVPHSRQQSPARHTTQRHTHDTAEAAVLRPYLIKRCGSLSGVQCLLGINGCYTVWHPQRAEYRVPRIGRGRTGPAYHHPSYLLGEFLFLSFNV